MYVDFHAHILPGADHGSRDLDHSLRQLRAAKAVGVDTIVAPPHFYLESGHTAEEFQSRRERAYEELVQANATGIRIVRGGEIHLSYDLPEIEGLEQLTIEGTNWLLLEMPSGIWQNWIADAIGYIESARKLRVVIAHIDRYEKTMQEKLLDMGCGIQVNAESLCNRRERRKLCKLFKTGQAHVLGSDVHTDAEQAYGWFEKAVKILGKDGETAMETARSILDGRKE